MNTNKNLGPAVLDANTDIAIKKYQCGLRNQTRPVQSEQDHNFCTLTDYEK